MSLLRATTLHESQIRALEAQIRNIPNLQLGTLSIVGEALRSGNLSLYYVRTSE